MRVVTRAELMQQPIGTVFRDYEPCVWRGEWMVFHGTYGPDFIESEIGPQPTTRNALEEETGELQGFPITDDCMRNGMFDHDALYVILDQADIEAITRQWAALGGLYVS